MKIRFIEDVTIYPDGVTPLDVADGDIPGVGAVPPLSEDYAQLMVDKGHAVKEQDEDNHEA